MVTRDAWKKNLSASLQELSHDFLITNSDALSLSYNGRLAEAESVLSQASVVQIAG